MAAGGGGVGQIPAGFTYLGQFVDHDLTFDKTNVMLGENVSPAQLLQARSPSLDLDSLYRGGPADPKSAGHQALRRQPILDRPRSDWRPSLNPSNQTFRMADLLLFAFKVQKALLNPFGGP